MFLLLPQGITWGHFHILTHFLSLDVHETGWREKKKKRGGATGGNSICMISGERGYKFLSWMPLSFSSERGVYSLPSTLSLSAFMFNVCCVMTSFCCHLCCWFRVSEPPRHPVHSRGKRRTTPGMYRGRFGGREPTEGRSLVAFWDADNHLLEEWLSTVMRRKGVKNPLPSTPTPNMWE